MQKNPNAANFRLQGTKFDKRTKIQPVAYEMLRRMHAVHKFTITAIAKHYGVSHSTISGILHPEKQAEKKAYMKSYNAKRRKDPAYIAAERKRSAVALKRKKSLLSQGLTLPPAERLALVEVAGTALDKRVKYPRDSPLVYELRKLYFAGGISIAEAARRVGVPPRVANTLVNVEEHRKHSRDSARRRPRKKVERTAEYFADLKTRKLAIKQRKSV